MTSPAIASTLIAGMTQATGELGKEWEALPEDDRVKLVGQWRQIIEDAIDPMEAASKIVGLIAGHPCLRLVWEGLGREIHASRLAVICNLVMNTTRQTQLESGTDFA